MFLFKINAFAATASFRIPENHTFQQTLPLPPITTLTGIMGAALGLSFKEVMQFRKEKGILFGVIGSSSGEMRDLWKYKKMKSSYKEDGSDRQDILIREFMTDFSLTVAVGSMNEAVLSEVRDGFLNPRYALSAGNSDDLLKVHRIGPILETREELGSKFENTVIAGDQTPEYESLIDLINTPITRKIRAPQVFLLPTAFEFKGEQRRVSKREPFTFIGSPIRLKDPVPTYRAEGDAFALL